MRKIDWNQPLSDEDRKWIDSFGNRAMRRQAEQSDKRFADARSAVAAEDFDDEFDSMTVEQLKAEAEARKDAGFSPKGIKTKSDLVNALREWDREH